MTTYIAHYDAAADHITLHEGATFAQAAERLADHLGYTVTTPYVSTGFVQIWREFDPDDFWKHMMQHIVDDNDDYSYGETAQEAREGLIVWAKQ